MHKKKSKKKSKKNKKESKRLSSTSSENDEKTSRREDSLKKPKSSEKNHPGRDHDSPTENTRRESSTSGKLVSETSPNQDRPFKTAVYRLGKTDSQREEKASEKTHTCRPASLSKDRRGTVAVLHEGANVSTSKPLGAQSTDTASPREQRSSSSKSSSGKSSHKSSSEASSSRHGPASQASSRQAPSPTALSADLEEQRKMLVRKRPRPEEKPTPADGKRARARVSPERPPSSGAEEPGEKRSRLGRRVSPEDARRTGKDQEGRQRDTSPLETTLESSPTSRDESSGTSTQASKPAVSKHVAELSETAKPAVAHFNTPNTKPKLPLTFTIPKKTKPITACSGIWDEDDKVASERKQKTTEAVRKPTQSKAEFGSKLMVPRKIRIGPMDRSSSVTKTKQIRGTAPEASVSVTPASPPLQKHEEKPSVVTSSLPTEASSSESAETHDTDQEMLLAEELHLARSERRLELNVEEIYGELTCMDIDPPEEGTVHTHNKELVQQELIVVLDTNVFLSHLDFVKKMISHGLGGLGFPTVLIPWVVLQELDSLKNGKRLSSSVAHLATPAVHYIYTSLKSQEPRLWGQSMQQASQSSLNLNTENNDDRVLQCCLQYQSLYPEGAVVLCTNDKNLCSKSLLSGVKALSKVDLVEEMEKATPLLLSPLHPQTPVPAPPLTHPRTPFLIQASSLTPTPQTSFQRTSPSPKPAGKDEGRISDGHQRARNEEKEKRKEVEEEEGRRRRCAAKEARELSVCVSALEDCLKGALSQILEVEMKAAFEDLWTEIVYIKPPWTLSDLLQCFRKHWIAVFGNIVPRSLLQSVENLCDFLRSGKTVKLRSATVAVCEARELLQSFSCRPVYSGSVSPALSSLDLLQQRLHALPEKALEERLVCDGDALMAEEEQGEGLSLHATHQEVWALFELIWTNVCQISSVVFTALRFDPAATAASQLVGGGPPPPPDALSCLQRLLSTVTQLLQGFSRVLSPDVSLEDSQALLSLIVSSQIAAVEPRCTAKQLQDCLSQQEYREKLFMGGAQMAELRGSLERCVEAMAHRTVTTPWL